MFSLGFRLFLFCWKWTNSGFILKIIHSMSDNLRVCQHTGWSPWGVVQTSKKILASIRCAGLTHVQSQTKCVDMSPAHCHTKFSYDDICISSWGSRSPISDRVCTQDRVHGSAENTVLTVWLRNYSTLCLLWRDKVRTKRILIYMIVLNRFFYTRIKKDESRGKNCHVRIMMYSKSINLSKFQNEHTSCAVSPVLEGFLCLLWTTDKERHTGNTYTFVSVEWKTKI
jgi:hypothetical protein